MSHTEPQRIIHGGLTPEAPGTAGTSLPPPPAGRFAPASRSAPVRKLAPPSELEQTLAFEAEFGVTVEAVRQSFLDDLRAWYERTTSGSQASTKPFRIVMRDVGLKTRGTSPDVVLARASSVVRAASTEQLAVYERWRRRKETP